jgi:fluoride exporter
MTQAIAVAIGGAVGAVARHLANQVCSQWLAAHSAWGTLAVNIVGCFLLGMLVPLGTGSEPRWNAVTHSALTVGFLGGLTTFSTFGFETHRLFHESGQMAAVLNIGANMILGLLAVSGGLAVGKWVAG